MGAATMAAREVVLSSTLIGPFEFEREREQLLSLNDFLIDLMRRLRLPDRLDGNENSMFRRPLGLLEENFRPLPH